jgi:hypothetical protein
MGYEDKTRHLKISDAELERAREGRRLAHLAWWESLSPSEQAEHTRKSAAEAASMNLTDSFKTGIFCGFLGGFFGIFLGEPFVSFAVVAVIGGAINYIANK